MTEDKAKVNAELENEMPDSIEVQEEPAIDKKETKKEKAYRQTKVEEQLEKTELELLELKDRHIRLQAEFDNYRSILPVIDDFDRAMQTVNLEEKNSHIKEGVQLIYNKFQDFLKQNGVKEIEAKEQDFDTDLHEAITKIPAPTDDLKGKIVDVVQKGYYLNDKVIRFSKVVIGE